MDRSSFLMAFSISSLLSVADSGLLVIVFLAAFRTFLVSKFKASISSSVMSSSEESSGVSASSVFSSSLISCFSACLFLVKSGALVPGLLSVLSSVLLATSTTVVLNFVGTINFSPVTSPLKIASSVCVASATDITRPFLVVSGAGVLTMHPLVSDLALRVTLRWGALGAVVVVDCLMSAFTLLTAAAQFMPVDS